MNRLKSLMGRRRFLAALGAASASALAFSKVHAGTGATTAPDRPSGTADATERPGSKYPHLLSPIRVRNLILKNRIMHTPSHPHTLQGPENYPADPIRSHYSGIAKNAALVSTDEVFGAWPKTWPKDWNADLRNENGRLHLTDHMRMWEDIPPVHNYLDQMIEDIHCEGALICGAVIGGDPPPGDPSGVSGPAGLDIITQAKRAEDKGYNAVWVGNRGPKNRKALAPVIEQMQAVRKATSLIIVAWLLPTTPGVSSNGRGGDEDGPLLEEVVAMAKMLEGTADILQMKDAGLTNHPNGFTMEKNNPLMLQFSRAIKESGAKIITCPTGGFHDPDLIDTWIADGKADMVGMATPLIADPEYVKKLNEGRGEDVVPCVMCHDCHGISKIRGPWISVCTVNPKFGLSESKKRSLLPPTRSKKVAVIGGGPGGMKAAITAAERGHRVTLYEKGDALGGLQRHTDHTKWKWPYRDFKDYLIRQVNKAGVEVLLNSPATPAMIKEKGYDTALVAVGSEPIVPNLPGVNGGNVRNIVDVYSDMKSLGKKVVLIGAGVFGTETGICLAKDGYHVTVLNGEKQLIPDEFIGPHNKINQIDIYEHHQNFNSVREATPTRISEGSVTYRDVSGKEKSVPADSVVIYAGMKPRMDEAMAFSAAADQVLFLGDCTGQAGTLQKTIRGAFFMGSQV